MDLKEGRQAFFHYFFLEHYLIALMCWTPAPPSLMQNDVNATVLWLWQSSLLCIEKGDSLLTFRKQGLSSSTDKKMPLWGMIPPCPLYSYRQFLQSGFSLLTVACITNKICTYLFCSLSHHTTGNWIVINVSVSE